MDVLQKTPLDPQGGYEFNPKVTTGPYKLESYDSAAHMISFAVSDRYKGSCEGMKPHIKRLVFQQVDNETASILLENGEIDLVSKITNPQARDGLHRDAAGRDAAPL